MALPISLAWNELVPEGEIFTRSEYRQVYPPGIERHFWHIARNDLINRWLQPRIAAGELVLDVGCGTGIVVDYLRSRGMKARGVEQGAAPVLPGLEGEILTGTDLFQLERPLLAEVSTVLLLDVLEHVDDRRDFLRRIHAALPHCRYLLITVPARGELWSEYDEHWGHHLRYDRRALEQELSGSGFAVRRTAYFFHWLYLASLAMSLLGIRKRTDFDAIPARGVRPLLHRVLGAFTRLESRLIPGFVAGSSIICLAERSTDASPSG
jgi:SAM-dependent methyltransferase